MNLNRGVTGLALAIAVGVAGCGSSDEGASTASSSKEPVTLLVWDQEVSEGPSATMEALNAQFEREHPDVKIERKIQGDFNAYQTQVKLALSSDAAPDVFQGNQGYGLDGQLVKAKLNLPLDEYAEQYGWDERFAEAILRPMRWSDDGSRWGEGSLYGVSPKAEIVGVFYNKKLLSKLGLELPETLEAFQASLDAAKAGGITPILVGGLDQWPMRDVLAPYVGVHADHEEVSDWIFGVEGSEFGTPGMLEALDALKANAEAGVFQKGFTGVAQEDATASFGKGGSLYFMTGPWENGKFTKALGNDVGFFVLPGSGGAEVSSEGGPSLPFEISRKSKHPDEAAKYIDFITGPEAATTWLKGGEVSALKDVDTTGLVPDGSSLQSIIAAYQEQSGSERMFEYLDYAAPTMTQVLLGGLQEFTTTDQSSEEFADKVQQAWLEFHDKR